MRATPWRPPTPAPSTSPAPTATPPSPPTQGAKGKRCTLLAPVGSFSHDDHAGPDSFVFTGRVNGKALRPGSYVLRATGRNQAGAGAPVDKPFRIVKG